MGVKTKLKITTLGEKLFWVLDTIRDETGIFKYSTPTAIREFFRYYNQSRIPKLHISSEEIENFIKLLEDNNLITVERK